MTDRLSIYNGALRKLKERALSSITENREPRRLLDAVWDSGGIRACLEAGQWSFANRKVSLSFSAGIQPEFDYPYAFELPTDYVRLTSISKTDTFGTPLTNYEFSSGFVFADVRTVYLTYVSDDPSYGGDFSLWPESFVEFVEWHFAYEIAPRLTTSDSLIDRVEQRMKSARSEAESIDTQRGPSKRIPLGSWSRARLYGGRNTQGWRWPNAD